MQIRPLLLSLGLVLTISGTPITQAATLDDPLDKICLPREPGAESFSASLIYGGPPSVPLKALSDGVVVFADWISGDGGYRALVLMVEYAIPNRPSCLVGYRGEMKDHKHPGQTFRRGEVLGVWAPAQAKNDR